MTIPIEMTSEKQTFTSVLSRLIWVSPLAMLAATAANLGLYYAAGILFPEVTAWSGAGPEQIVSANVVYLLIGAFVFAAITRLSPRPARHYLILASIGLLLSLGLPISTGFGYGPPGTPAAGAVTVITLSLMHIMSYAISVPLYIRLALD
jgi:uncharacterized protein DUF6069